MKAEQLQKQTDRELREDTKTFFTGVCILSLSTVLVKVIGLAAKIPLLGRLGPEGMGYFNSAYEIYALLCVLSTSGLPTALSILISGERVGTEEGRVRARQIFMASLWIFLFLGALGTLALAFGADSLSSWIENPNARYCILAIAPAVLLVCIGSAVRGYFQGMRNMTPTAISQLLEAVGKLLFGVLFADLALAKGASVPIAAAASVFGVSLGCLISALYLLIYKRKKGEKYFASPLFCMPYGRIAKNLLKIAIPITLSSVVISSTRMVDMTMMIRRLQDIGLGVAEANRTYGAYTTLAVPVFSLLPSLIAPVSMALIPQLNGAIGRGCLSGQKLAIESSFRWTVLLSMPASMAIILFAKPILNLLFSGEGVAISLSAPLLSLLGGSVLFSGMITTTNAVLQAYRRVGLPILSMSAGVLIKTVTAYFLIGNPRIGAFGAPISTFLCNVTVTAMNLCFISRCTKRLSISFGRVLLRPLLPSLISVAGAFGIYLVVGRRIAESVSFLVAVVAAIVLYCLLSLGTGVLEKGDLQMILPRTKEKKINS